MTQTLICARTGKDEICFFMCKLQSQGYRVKMQLYDAAQFIDDKAAWELVHMSLYFWVFLWSGFQRIKDILEEK